MTTADDPRLRRVRKLLALAEDAAATPAEAEAFTAKATDLIQQYGIDQALLDGRDAPSRIDDLKVSIPAPYAREKASLCASIASALRCEAVQLIRRSGDERTITMHIFGRSSDLTSVELLFTSLLLQGTSAIVQAKVPRGEHAAAFRRTWWLGFANAIGRRLRLAAREAAAEAEGKFAEAGTSAAVVLASHEAEAEAAMRDAYPDAGPMRRRRLSGSGMSDGWASGQRADLGGGQRLGSGYVGEIA